MASLVFIPLEKGYEAQQIDNVAIIGRDREFTEIDYVKDGEESIRTVENIGGYWKVKD